MEPTYNIQKFDQPNETEQLLLKQNNNLAKKEVIVDVLEYLTEEEKESGFF